MKKSIALLALLVSVPVLSATTRTTTTNVYEETATSPATSPEMIEAQEYDDSMEGEEYDEDMNNTQERMEERTETTTVEKSDEIDYSDRTRTNRERKALNTGSHASDDQ